MNLSRPTSTQTQSAAAPEAKPWVLRLFQKQGVTLDVLQAGWWSFHSQGFLR
jgi:hypothetical protein